MGMLWKIQKICSTMGTKIFEIDEEMFEIMPKLATLKIQQARNEPILANPEI